MPVSAAYRKAKGRHPEPQPGFTLDAGALIALQKQEGRIRALLRLAEDNKLPIAIPVGVIGQIWRGGDGPQAPISRLLNDSRVEVVDLDHNMAREVGILCKDVANPDVVDGSVVLCARKRGHIVITTDPNDMRALDANVLLESTN